MTPCGMSARCFVCAVHIFLPLAALLRLILPARLLRGRLGVCRRHPRDSRTPYITGGAGCETTLDWLHDPGLRGLSASDDGSECGGWRRELGDDEVCENYMDAKFGGEDADMGEIMMW